MKKTYIIPTFLAVELSSNRNLMLTGSSNEGGNIISDGGPGDGTDIGAKENRDVNIWDEEW